MSPPGGAGLELRDVEAFDGRRAVVLAIGEGEASRVLRTDDGGATWSESFRNTDAKAFYDCVTFFDRRHGLAMSDPVDGKYRLLSTADGGRSWKVLPSAGMPAAQEGEAAFAASGQCLVASGPRDVWLATGGRHARVVQHSADRGLTWTAADAPIPAGDPARGVFGLAFRDRTHGIAVAADSGGPGLAPGGRGHRGRRPHLDPGRAPAARLPLGRRVVPAQPGHGPRGRPDGHRRHAGRRADLADVRRGVVRHGRLRRGPWLLGVRREGADRPAGAALRPIAATDGPRRPPVTRATARGSRPIRVPSSSRRTR